MHALQAVTLALATLLPTTLALPNPEPQAISIPAPAPAPGHLGAMCNDPSQCIDGLRCRFGLFNRDHQQCLFPIDREYGSSCSSNSDCNVPLICNINAFGTQNVCTLEADILGPRACNPVGGTCFTPNNCCSRACRDLRGRRVCTRH